MPHGYKNVYQILHRKTNVNQVYLYQISHKRPMYTKYRKDRPMYTKYHIGRPMYTKFMYTRNSNVYQNYDQIPRTKPMYTIYDIEIPMYIKIMYTKHHIQDQCIPNTAKKDQCIPYMTQKYQCIPNVTLSLSFIMLSRGRKRKPDFVP